MMAPVRRDPPRLLCAAAAHLERRLRHAALVTYDEGYENSLHFSGCSHPSPTSSLSSCSTASACTARTSSRSAAGRATFSACSVRLGDNSGVGFDPSYSPSQTQPGEAEDRLSFVPALFPAEGTSSTRTSSMPATSSSMSTAEGSGGERPRSVGSRPCGFYAEVPDGGYLLEHSAVWDLVYEHPSHFTQSSLTWLLQDAGFGVVRSGDALRGPVPLRRGGARGHRLGERPDRTSGLWNGLAACRRRGCAAIARGRIPGRGGAAAGGAWSRGGPVPRGHLPQRCPLPRGRRRRSWTSTRVSTGDSYPARAARSSHRVGRSALSGRGRRDEPALRLRRSRRCSASRASGRGSSRSPRRWSRRGSAPTSRRIYPNRVRFGRIRLLIMPAG